MRSSMLAAARVGRTRKKSAGGTSADRQLATYERLLAAGVTQSEALQGVVDMLIEETLES